MPNLAQRASEARTVPRGAPRTTRLRDRPQRPCRENALRLKSPAPSLEARKPCLDPDEPPPTS